MFSRGSSGEQRRLADVLRQETVGGALLLAAAMLALIWSNSPWSSGYTWLRDLRLGPGVVHLHLSLAQWASDGLLAVFFFVAGLELKREFVAGDLRDPRRAAVPVVAALAGVALPAMVYVLVNLGPGGSLAGWAIPSATDIAFALAVLALAGTHLPAALRTFLLTLAVIDDLAAITIIAVFYTRHLAWIPLGLSLAPLVAFTVAVQRRIRAWWLLLPLAVTAWALIHASGVHATVGGVLLGFAVPVARRRAGPGPGLAEHFEHRWRPVSAGLAVPLFALLSAGVAIGGVSGLGAALTDRAAVGVVAGLVVGKSAGVLAGTFLTARLTRARLDEGIDWLDVVGLALLAGIGFTVSLLIGELAFGAGTTGDHVKIGILCGSVLAALLAIALLRARNRHYRRLADADDATLDA
ncbi:MAG: Na+/H+ antiporter NhaA [Actinocatenispora sp.]